uniref:Acetyl-coenzyme A synthetase n=1 Tax=Acrobeloides nanus TaxID=290746 RepID=A0A914DL70_9BILA
MSDYKVHFDLNVLPAEDIFEPPAPLLAGAHVRGLPNYYELYKESINNPDRFWKTVASQLYFETDSDRGLEYNFDHRKGDVFIRFMSGARSNIAYNCLERNIAKGLGSKVALKWEGNEPADSSQVTYQELLDKVVAFSAVLRSKGVRKGDTVAIYLPMIIELPVAMLACARIGTIHTVVFAGFSSDSLATRILQAKAKVLVTADGCFRGNKPIHLKMLADQAVGICLNEGHRMDSVIVLEHLKRVTVPAKAKVPEVLINKDLDVFWDQAVDSVRGVESPVEWNEAEDPLFILYTSGSTGAPKGIVHTTIGYMVYTYLTTKLSFDAQPDDIYWCTADCGWITGHSYVTYGPLLNGMTVVIHEGVPTYPDPSRMWEMVEKYKVTKLYTAPTAVRALMAFSKDLVTKHDRSSLKIIGTVGEPINPSAWKWLYHVVGEDKCAVVDTYWQTETGGHVIVPLPGATPTKPGAATLPFLGVEPALVDHRGAALEGPGEGNLCMARAWPGMMRTVYGDHSRFVKTFFSSFPGYYFTGDGARRDDDSYYWITGRVDDLMNVSGHLLSTAEIESALVLHPDVVEAAVVAAPHDIKGQFPYAFVSLVNGKSLTDTLIAQLKATVREKIGALAMPDIIQEAPGLPKTRSGKITRRILRKIAEGDKGADLGDTTTLIDQSVIVQLWSTRPAVKTG